METFVKMTESGKTASGVGIDKSDKQMLETGCGVKEVVESAFHQKSRYEKPANYPDRFSVSDDQVDWDIGYPGYDPPYFVDPVVLAEPSWADSEDVSLVGRSFESFEECMRFDELGRPLNPRGRTGIAGRGELGGWGANFAADPVVTRWNPYKQVFQMVAIKRVDGKRRMVKDRTTGLWAPKDSKLEWAIPGGMVDLGEIISQTLARELQEETGVALDPDRARNLYKGYVDDPRNTDHAWMETTVAHWNLSFEEGERLRFKPMDEDEIEEIGWLDLTGENLGNMYASHQDFVRLAMKNNE